MDAPYYNGSEPDPHPEGRGKPDAPLHRCRDCSAEIYEGGISNPLVQAVYCSPCWKWREAQGVEFDTRAKLQIETALRQGAA